MRLIERLRWWAHECDRTNRGCQARETLLEAADEIERLQSKAEPVKHGRMRVEVETFDDYYREYFFCPSCDLEIGHKTWDEKRQFGQGTVLHSNKFPNYCPNCGAKVDGGENNAVG